MKKRLLLNLAFFLFFTIGYSQSPIWTKIEEAKLTQLDKVERASFPANYQLYHLNLPLLKSQLSAAPSRESNTNSNLVIEFPNADGKLMRYAIYESSVLAPALAAAHPEIQSYIGKGIDDPTATIHFSVTLFGLHTVTNSGVGAFYVDPYTKNLQNYIVYNKSSLTKNGEFTCHTEDNATRQSEISFPQTSFSIDSNFRTYRLAMACTIEYANYHVNAAGLSGGTEAQKKAAVLAAMTVTVNRVNSVYEKDMALRMQLVANNTDIIFVTTDSFNNNDANTLINQSQNVITANIGASNFDIGHTVSTGGGGLAGLGVVCVEGQKASGITGLNAPVGDPYDIDYVAHEMGHQFGAQHTFNNSCGGNRSSSSAMEPGSGSTIMAYAGICPPNVQNNSNTYFHARSILQMYTHITNTGNCVVGVPNGNNPPVIPDLTSYTIPNNTAFVLRGSATDANGDALTYCWEQMNAGATTEVAYPETTASVPNFRSLSPSTSPNRYMPVLSSVMAGDLAPTWEVVPNVARTMNFGLTVRDNRTPNGGQTARKNMTVAFSSTASTFAVTSQTAVGTIWTGNSNQTVTWNVVGTTAAPISTANVNILLSSDGGVTFPVTLLSNTPNDGTQVITVPNNIQSANCRIMVEAVGNIFYAVNSRAFTVNMSLSASDFSLSNFKIYPNPNNGNFSVQLESSTGNDIKINVSDIRGRQIFSKSFQNTGLFEQNLDLNNAQSGVYMVTVQDGDRKETKKIVIQ
jgi:hypothetical protein